jgi:hypothetical protein
MLKSVEGFYQDGQIQLIDRLEIIANIQQGFEEIDAGQTMPIEDFIQEMQQKYELEDHG